MSRHATAVFLVLVVIGVLLAGETSAQQVSCCAARLQVCRHDVDAIEYSSCLGHCVAWRNEAEADCERDPGILCNFINNMFARCNQRCVLQRNLNRFICLVRFRECVLGRECENSPTPTRTVTRTATPSMTPRGLDPMPPADVMPTATPTPTPPR